MPDALAQPCAPRRGRRISIGIIMNTCIDINIIASRIPAARPEGSLFAVPGFLSLCVRKLHYPAEEEDDECLSILPDRRTVCLSIWEDLVKKGVY